MTRDYRGAPRRYRRATPSQPSAPTGRDAWIPRTRRQVQLILTAFVMAMIVALLINIQLGRDLGSHFTPLLDTVLQIKQGVTAAHLWFEDALETQDQQALEDVWWHMAQAVEMAKQALQGDPAQIVPVSGQPQGELRAMWEALLKNLKLLRSVAEQRAAEPELGKTGSALDREYDGTIRTIFVVADHIETSLKQRVARNLDLIKQVQFMLIGACLLLLASGGWFITSHIGRLAREVQHRRAAEEELARSREAALAARDQAESAVKAKDLLLAKISHEVRTPINAIIGMTTLIEDTGLDSAQREYLRMLDAQTRDLLHIMDDLLDFSRMEAGKLTLNPAPLDLRRLVADAVDLAVPRAQDKGICLDADLPLVYPEQVIGDAVRIRQVLLNLLNNAIKFTEQGEVVVGLRGRYDEQGQFIATLWVLDSGIGIPQDKRRHVFQPFAQADDTMARRFGGTGLGLAICRELVELMHGRIELEDGLGTGSRFWCELPLDPVSTSPVRSALAVPGMRVLVADRDDAIRQRTCALLQELGAQPTPVADAAAALRELAVAAAAGQSLPALLVNERLGEVAARQLIATVRTDPASAGAPIYLMVRNAARVTAISADKGGATACLSIPHRALLLPGLLMPPERTPAAAAQTRASGPEQPRFDLDALLVDDHPVTQIAGRHMLESLGCRVESARNGSEALARWEAKAYDVIFMDWQMPDMDGLEVAARIRAQEQRTPRARSYIVAMTANAMTGDRQRCLDAGMDEYISKPVTKDSFSWALRGFPARQGGAVPDEQLAR